MYDFDNVIDRSTSDSAKYRVCDKIFGTSEVIPLWVADTDFASADCIVQALQKRADHQVFGYTYRCEDFDNAVKGWLLRRSGWSIQNEWIAFSPGVVVGFTLAMLSCTSEGDGVLIQQPVYHPFAMAIKANNRVVVNNSLIHTEEGYRIDFEDFEQKLNTAKAFFLCNPHNPTGRCFTESELRQMGELCVKHDVRIISDEIHSDYVFAPHRHCHIASLSPEIADRTITFIAPSKSFNIAGLGTAVAISSSKEVLNGYKKEQNKLHLDSMNVFGATALKAAYNHGDEWLDQMKDYLEGNIDYVLNFLATNLPGVKCHKPEATYLMWLDFSAWGMSQQELNKFMITRAKLGLSDGVIYGEQGAGFQRVNIGSPRSVIEKAMNQLLRAAQEAGL